MHSYNFFTKKIFHFIFPFLREARQDSLVMSLNRNMEMYPLCAEFQLSFLFISFKGRPGNDHVDFLKFPSDLNSRRFSYTLLWEASIYLLFIIQDRKRIFHEIKRLYLENKSPGPEKSRNFLLLLDHRVTIIKDLIWFDPLHSALQS